MNFDVVKITVDRTQAVSETGSADWPPEDVMVDVVMLVVGTESGCRACMSQV